MAHTHLTRMRNALCGHEEAEEEGKKEKRNLVQVQGQKREMECKAGNK